MQGHGRRAIALAIGLTALAVPSAAPAQEAADANCPGPGNALANGAGDARFAQTFTAQNSGDLTRAEVRVSDPTGGTNDNFRLDIVAVDSMGNPTNTVLATTTASPGADGTPRIIGASFASPAAVTAGQQYALVVSRPGGENYHVAFYLSDACAGGEFFSSPNQTSAFVDQGTRDMVFTAYVTPPAPPGDGAQTKAERTLTLDANKGKVEKGKKVRLSGQLEAAGNDSACEASQSIEIVRTGLKGGTPVPVTTVQTDAQGNFATKVKVTKSSLYTGEVDESSACERETSDTEKVRVQKPKAAKEA